MPSIFIKNQEMYVENVVVTDDNGGGRPVFSGSIQPNTDSPPFAVQVSSAGFIDVHYSVNGGGAVASALMNDGDYILI